MRKLDAHAHKRIKKLKTLAVLVSVDTAAELLNESTDAKIITEIMHKKFKHVKRLIFPNGFDTESTLLKDYVDSQSIAVIKIDKDLISFDFMGWADRVYDLNFRGNILVNFDVRTREEISGVRSIMERSKVSEHLTVIIDDDDDYDEQSPDAPVLRDDRMKNELHRIPFNRYAAWLLNYRQYIWEITFDFAKLMNWNFLVDKRFHVYQNDDQGTGCGLMKEWFAEVFKVLFNPDLGLFKRPRGFDSVYFYYPNETAVEIPNYHEGFKFFGLMVGIAMKYPIPIGFRFADFFLKSLQGKPLKLHDLRQIDFELHDYLKWIRNTKVLREELYFVYDNVELINGGSAVRVTDKNKHEYVKKILELVLNTRIKRQVDGFLTGFSMVVDRSEIDRLTVEELGERISGKLYIDIDEWKRYTEYSGFTGESIQIAWFWRFMRTLHRTELRKILELTTGSPAVPIGGFGALAGRNGALKRFKISRSPMEHVRLPYFKTYSNMIGMPMYKSYDDLAENFRIALNAAISF